MTVGELIEMLKCFDEDHEVIFEIPVGDYYDNIIAHRPTCVRSTFIKHHEHFKTNVVTDLGCDEEAELYQVISIS